MLRKVSFLGACALALLAPLAIQAQETAGKVPVPEVAGVTVALPSTPAPAVEAGVCPAAKPAIEPLVHTVRQVTSCTSYACGLGSPVNCTQLCGDFATCSKIPGPFYGHCMFQ
jgi:hypothetical protein